MKINFILVVQQHARQHVSNRVVYLGLKSHRRALMYASQNNDAYNMAY